MAPPRFPPSSSAARLPPRSTPPEPRPSPPAAAAGAAALAPGSLEEVLLQAAFDGNLRLVRKMARALDEGDGRRLGDKVGAVRDGNGVGALHLAAGRGSLPVCGYLLEELRVDIDAVEDRGETALTFAINSGNADMVRYLLDHGADTEKLNNDGLTVLHFASGEELKIFLVGAVLTKLVSSLPSRDACRVESPRC
ncbi:uncharacterized protein [Oryza sativa Japonica Group]|uniref:uncharacterized protein isoform X2 n=1 Tax=Oryza sativa subsp. japonica TaxID=39947 RepID=UPI00339CDA5E